MDLFFGVFAGDEPALLRQRIFNAAASLLIPRLDVFLSMFSHLWESSLLGHILSSESHLILITS